MENAVSLNQSNISSLRTEFPWLNDEVISSVITAVRSQEIAVVLYSAAKQSANVLQFNPTQDLTPQWGRYKAKALQLLSETCPDIFRAATPSEKLSLIVTETSEGLFNSDGISPVNRGFLTAFVVYATQEAVGRGDVNLIILEDRGEDVALRAAVVEPNPGFD